MYFALLVRALPKFLAHAKHTLSCIARLPERHVLRYARMSAHFMHTLSPLKFMFLFKKIDFTLLRISARRQKTLLFGRDSEEPLCQISRALTGAFRIQFAWFLAQYICVFQWTRRCSVLRITRTDEVKRVLSCVLT